MPETPATPLATAPQNLESLALQSAPAIGRGIVSQSGIWGLMFVLLVVAQMVFAIYVIPQHLDKINAGHKEAWDSAKAAIESERIENRANLAAQRELDSRSADKIGSALDAFGQRIDRGFDRIRDRGGRDGAVGIGTTAKAARDGG